MKREEMKAVLDMFLSMPLYSSKEVFKAFSSLKGAVYKESMLHEKQRFLYIPGTREDRVLLAAHADTVWDEYYIGERLERMPVWENGIVRGSNPLCGLGADDRAGCAMLYLLKDSGHSLLILDGEEHGQIGANYLMDCYPELAREINNHRYIIQLDRRGSSDYKTYRLPVTEDFLRFIEAKTGYQNAGYFSCTDIVALCREICGVNLSVGYHEEHRSTEHLVYAEWEHTMEMVGRILAEPQDRYLLMWPANPWIA